MATGILDYLDKTHGKRKWKPLFEKTFDHVLERLERFETCEVSLSLVTDEEQRELNRTYRQIDRTTDVLTFAYLEDGDEADRNLPMTDLGTITISPTVARRQAKEFAHPLERELAFLFIHGLLHIFGYDHVQEDEAKVMFDLQNSLLNSLEYDFYTNLPRLKKELKKAQENAVATYSHFRVGAVVVTKDGHYIPGFNIENASYPATICAERVALAAAYSRGYRKDDIASLGCLTDSHRVGTCCGVCRQVMAELMPMNAPVYIFSSDLKDQLFTTVKDLLPSAFTMEDLHA